MSDRGFSEISLVFNDHIGNLDRARHVFEDESRTLNDYILDHLAEVVNRPNEEPIQKIRWSDPRDWSTSRDVSWTNFFAGTQLSMDVRQPGYKIFRRAAGYVYFEVVFDTQLDYFVFQCRFENQNLAHSEIDEEICRIIDDKPDAYPLSEHVKANTAILFKRKLSSELFDTINQMVEDSLSIIAQAVNSVFPDEAYAVQEEPAELEDHLPESPPSTPKVEITAPDAQ